MYLRFGGTAEPVWPHAKFMGFNKEKMLPNEMEDSVLFDGQVCTVHLIVHTWQPLVVCLRSATRLFQKGKMFGRCVQPMGVVRNPRSQR